MRRLGVLTAAAAALMLAGSGCVANPGPPPVEDVDHATTTTTPARPPAPDSNRLTIGIDPLSGGFNPHLVADSTPFVQAMASLVLPSAFVNGERDSSLLSSAEEIAPAPGAVQTVRYTIAPAAQWSDGTPITGADFRYLWQSISSTPGAFDASAYQQIGAVRVSEAGKTVEVDFFHRVADWHRLFTHLLPSHIFLTGTDGFDRVLSATMPVSGGRYQVSAVDRQRGEVVLSRNDRYWGTSPAHIERLVFREIRSTSGAAEMLRRGQMDVADLRLEETTVQALGLLPHVQSATRVYPQRLDLVFSQHSAVLDTPAKRAGFSSLIDVPLVASLAAGRHARLGLPAPSEYPQPVDAPEEVKPGTTVTLGVDPADERALAAARTIADLAAAASVKVEVVTAGAAELYSELVPNGKVDGAVTRSRSELDPATVADHYMCGVSLSGYCDDQVDEALESYLAQGDDVDGVRALVREIENQAVVTLPLSYSIRIDAAGDGVVGPSPVLEEWPLSTYGGRLTTAPQWRLAPREEQSLQRRLPQ